MDSERKSINEILNQIKSDIEKEAIKTDIPNFEDVPYREPVQVSDGISAEDNKKSIRYLNSHYYIQSYKELKGNSVKQFFCRLIRRLTKFYVEPIVAEQNEFNANIVSVMNYYSEKEKELHQLMRRVEKLEIENEKLRRQIERREEK